MQDSDRRDTEKIENRELIRTFNSDWEAHEQVQTDTYI